MLDYVGTDLKICDAPDDTAHCTIRSREKGRLGLRHSQAGTKCEAFMKCIAVSLATMVAEIVRERCTTRKGFCED